MNTIYNTSYIMNISISELLEEELIGHMLCIEKTISSRYRLGTKKPINNTGVKLWKKVKQYLDTVQ